MLLSKWSGGAAAAAAAGDLEPWQEKEGWSQDPWGERSGGPEEGGQVSKYVCGMCEEEREGTGLSCMCVCA